MGAYIPKFLGEKSPCDSCSQAQYCKENEVACRAFAYFVWHGTFKPYTARIPTKKTFDRIFFDEVLPAKQKKKTAKKGFKNA